METVSDLGFSGSTEARDAGTVPFNGTLNQGMVGMKRARIIVVGFAAFAMTAGAAVAADVPPVVIVPPAPPPPTAPAFDWAGIYIGVHAGDFLGPSDYNYGVHGGFNFVNGSLLYGVDARASALGPIFIYEAMVRARAGFLLGDRVLVFVAGGAGWTSGPGGTGLGLELGGGVELALGQSLSIRAEVNQTFIAAGFLPNIPTFWTVGLTFHPGN